MVLNTLFRFLEMDWFLFIAIFVMRVLKQDEFMLQYNIIFLRKVVHRARKRIKKSQFRNGIQKRIRRVKSYFVSINTGWLHA